MPNKRENPLWETLVMVASFAFLWIWILSAKAAHAQGANLGPQWMLFQLIAAGALFVIFVRRVQRAKKAFREADTSNRATPRPAAPKTK